MLDYKEVNAYVVSVNKLTLAKRCQVLALLCEGMSMRAITRIADVSMNAVVKLLEDAGEACLDLHNEEVRGVNAERVQCDEVWSFCYAKAKNVKTAKAAPEIAGDVWTWTAIDADTKLIISFLVNDRSALTAEFLIRDLAERVANRMQLTTDSHKAYLSAVRREFQGEIDYAQLVKIYEKGGMKQQPAEARYSPPVCTGIRRKTISGNPDPAHVSTSFVERSNLSLRMHNRRFTRLTNAFSKRFVSHVRMVALYTMFYNFIRIHKTLRVTPAMQANITDRVWGFEDIVERMDRDAPIPLRGQRGPYKKRELN